MGTRRYAGRGGRRVGLRVPPNREFFWGGEDNGCGKGKCFQGGERKG